LSDGRIELGYALKESFKKTECN